MSPPTADTFAVSVPPLNFILSDFRVWLQVLLVSLLHRQRLAPGKPAATAKLEYTGTPATGLTSEIYLFENAKVALYPATDWQLNPCIVVGGSYKNGSTTFYRLDFANGTTLHDIVRNHSYNFSISAVTARLSFALPRMPWLR